MTFAQRMVAKFEALLMEATGLRSVQVNGTTVAYDDLERQYQFWLSRVARESGKPRIVRFGNDAAMSDETKVCTGCHRELPVERFCRRLHRRCPICRECQRARDKLKHDLYRRVNLARYQRPDWSIAPKYCGHCHRWKTRADFVRNATCNDGCSGYCRSCFAAYERARLARRAATG